MFGYVVVCLCIYACSCVRALGCLFLCDRHWFVGVSVVFFMCVLSSVRGYERCWSFVCCVRACV